MTKKQAVLRRAFIIIYTWILLFLCRVLIFLFPLKRLQRIVGKPVANLIETNNSTNQIRKAFSAGRYVRKAAKFAFWKTNCYDQALATAVLLQHSGISFNFLLGLNKKNSLKAHAWINVNGHTVIGRHQKGLYSIIGIFTCEKKQF